MSLRLFIGVSLDEQLTKACLDFQSENDEHVRRLREFRWTRAENLHVTTYFLGATDERDLPEACSVLEGICRKTPAFTLESPTFGLGPPGVRRPRMVWLHFDRNETFVRLAVELGTWLAALRRQKEVDHEEPLAHVTLARFQAESALEAERAFPSLRLPRAPGILAANGLFLWESTTLPGGPRYRPLAQFALSGG